MNAIAGVSSHNNIVVNNRSKRCASTLVSNNSAARVSSDDEALSHYDGVSSSTPDDGMLLQSLPGERTESIEDKESWSGPSSSSSSLPSSSNNPSWNDPDSAACAKLNRHCLSSDGLRSRQQGKGQRQISGVVPKSTVERGTRPYYKGRRKAVSMAARRAAVVCCWLLHQSLIVSIGVFLLYATYVILTSKCGGQP